MPKKTRRVKKRIGNRRTLRGGLFDKTKPGQHATQCVSSDAEDVADTVMRSRIYAQSISEEEKKGQFLDYLFNKTVMPSANDDNLEHALDKTKLNNYMSKLKECILFNVQCLNLQNLDINLQLVHGEALHDLVVAFSKAKDVYEELLPSDDNIYFQSFKDKALKWYQLYSNKNPDLELQLI